MIVKRTEPPTTQEKEAVPKAPFRLAGFRTAYVFDVSQPEGKPLPEFAKTTGDPKDYRDKLKTMAVDRGIAVEYDASLGNAMGVSSGGRIRLKPDLSKAEEFAVLAHELAHEMLHHGKEERFTKVVRETQAAAVAFVVCQGIGLETNTAAADYIKLYSGDKKTLTESLSVIQETSAQILTNSHRRIAACHPQQQPTHRGRCRRRRPPAQLTSLFPWIADRRLSSVLLPYEPQL